jgi:hypothetical protein
LIDFSNDVVYRHQILQAKKLDLPLIAAAFLYVQKNHSPYILPYKGSVLLFVYSQGHSEFLRMPFFAAWVTIKIKKTMRCKTNRGIMGRNF